jgi:hypothetical protein
MVSCRSPEGADSLQRWLSGRIEPDRVVTDTVRTLPGGAERVRTVGHRLGDYFADIRLLPASPPAPGSFRLVFHKLPQAGRFWKDLMVNILQEVEARPEVVSVTLDYKGDEGPAAGPVAG